MTVMLPPTRSIVLPQAVADAIRSAQEDEMTGSITLHLHKGQIATVENRTVTKVPIQLTTPSPRP